MENIDNEVLSCVNALNREGHLYYQYVYNRVYNICINERSDGFSLLKRLLQSGIKNEEYMAQLINLFIELYKDKHEFLFGLLITDFSFKHCIISSFLMNNIQFSSLEKVLLKLFCRFPQEEELYIRDTLFSRYMDVTNKTNTALKILSLIPCSKDVYYSEFISLLNVVVEKDSLSPQILNIMINYSFFVEDPLPLINIIKCSNVSVPDVFQTWVRTSHDISFDKVEKVNLADSPYSLRHLLLFPEEMDTPSLCRNVNKGNKNIQIERIKTEKDPRLLHDLLYAYPVRINLSFDIPIKYILLAKEVVSNPNMVSDFEYVITKATADYFNTKDNIISAIAKSIEIVSYRHQEMVRRMFPTIRKLLRHRSHDIKVHLFKALGNATKFDFLHSEFLWREYHSIFTLTENDDFDDIIHYCILGLYRPQLRERAVEILNFFYKITDNTRNRKGIIQDSLLVVNQNCIEENYITHLLQGTRGHNQSIKDDTNLKNAVLELINTDDVTLKMLILNVLVVHFDIFSKCNEKWIKLLTDTGRCVFNHNIKEIDENWMESFMESNDENERLSYVFSLSVLLAHDVIESKEKFVHILKNRLDDEKIPHIRMVILFCLSLVSVYIEEPKKIIEGVVDNKNPHIVHGIGYFVRANFSKMLGFIEKNSDTSPFFQEIQVFMNEDISPIKSPLSSYIFRKRDFAGDLIDKDENLSLHDLILVLYGPIPQLAFSTVQISLTETQREILDKHSGPEYDIIRYILARKRPVHTFNFKQTTSEKTLIQRLKSDWRLLTDDDFKKVLIRGSEDQLIKTDEDYSLALAIRTQMDQDISRLFISKIRSRELYTLFHEKLSTTSKLNIYLLMIDNKAKLHNFLVLISFDLFNEILDETILMSMLPRIFYFYKDETNFIYLYKRFVNLYCKEQNLNYDFKEIKHAVLMYALGYIDDQNIQDDILSNF